MENSVIVSHGTCSHSRKAVVGKREFRVVSSHIVFSSRRIFVTSAAKYRILFRFFCGFAREYNEDIIRKQLMLVAAC